MIWSRRESTEEKIIGSQRRAAVDMGWCLMFPLTVTAVWRRRGREVGVAREMIGMWIKMGGGRDRRNRDIRKGTIGSVIEIAKGREKETGMDIGHEVGATIGIRNAVTELGERR
jgi:hypothetical protein